MNKSSHSVAVKPVAPYIGGKRLLSNVVIERLSTIPHRTYAEPFVGMGGVFLRRPAASPVEVINDRSRDVATLFRLLQRHFEPMMDMLKWRLTTRADFDRLMAVDPDTLTDLERAARFLYLQRTSFGGKVAGRNFGVSKGNSARFDVTKLVPLLEAVHERLCGVVIECLGWSEFVRRYDSPETLFYADPPYFGSEADYGSGVFARSDFAQLAIELEAIKGRFVLSLNDRPEVRETFQAFHIEAVETTYSIGRENGKSAKEILITNVK